MTIEELRTELEKRIREIDRERGVYNNLYEDGKQAAYESILCLLDETE